MCRFNYKVHVCPCEVRKNCNMIKTKNYKGTNYHVIGVYSYVGWGAACDTEMARIARPLTDSRTNLGRQSCPNTQRYPELEKDEPVLETAKCSQCAVWCTA